MIGQSGFVVLRKPENNFDELGRGSFSSSPPKIKNLYYGGVERMEWFDVDEDFYMDSLPSDLAKIRSEIWSKKKTTSDLKLCSDVNNALSLLDYSNKKTARNELVWISDENVAESSRHAERYENIKLTKAGLDIYCDGYGSLIKNGIFFTPNDFEEFFEQINRNGLVVEDSAVIDSYIEKYRQLASRNKVEPAIGKLQKLAIYNVLRAV